MIEFAEARVLARQIEDTLIGKAIQEVTVEQSPHKFAFFLEDSHSYGSLLKGKTMRNAQAYGGQLELLFDDVCLVFSDGVVILYHQKGEMRPKKHQLLLEFEDGSALSCSVLMYGGLYCFPVGANDNVYYQVAKEKPSPLSDEFNLTYFMDMIAAPGMEKLSAKAFLATEQRIPGLGNGVLQDILFNAGIHPKRKIKTLSQVEIDKLFAAVKSSLAQMIESGGRDTEKNLFGKYGGYVTKLSKKTVNTPCSICHTPIVKEAYLGGSIYYCSGCQVL